MIRVVDVRSGVDVTIGQTITYPGGEWWTLLGIDDRLLSAVAKVRTPTEDRRVPLQVRYTHPNFFLQRIGFLEVD